MMSNGDIGIGLVGEGRDLGRGYLGPVFRNVETAIGREAR